MQPGTNRVLPYSYPTTNLCPGCREPLSHRRHEKLALPVPLPRGPKQLQPVSPLPRPSSARRISSCPSRRRWMTRNRTSSRRRTFRLFRPVRLPTGRFHRATSRLISNERHHVFILIEKIMTSSLSKEREEKKERAIYFASVVGSVCALFSHWFLDFLKSLMMLEYEKKKNDRMQKNHHVDHIHRRLAGVEQRKIKKVVYDV